jgi:O-antigen/teichoic acid export membrane protein
LAATPAAAAEIAGRALWLRAAFALMVVGFALLAGSLRSADDVGPLAALVVGLMLAGLAETCGFVLRGIGRVRRETILLLGLRVTTAAAGLTAVLFTPSPLSLSLAYALAGAIGATVAFGLVREAIPGLRFARPSAPALGAMLADAGPLGVAVLFSIAFTRAPLLILDAVLGPSDAAAYSVAQRLTEPLAILPASFMAPLFPLFAIAAAGPRPREAVAQAGRQALIFGMFGAGIAAVFGLAGPWLIGTLYPGGQYDSSIAPLRWLALALIPSFANYALTHLLIAQRRARLNVVFVLIQLVVCVGISLALTPVMGPAGPALAILICEALLLVLCILAR